jgi:RNA polymerase sigma-70 factor (ECF subfamily)
MNISGTSELVESIYKADANFESESELIEGLRCRDDSAYETLVCEYGGRMLSVARKFLRCEQDARDAVQDAFISAFQGIQSFAANSSLSTWLHRIVVNACLMKLRSQSRKREVAIDDLMPTFDSLGQFCRPVSQWCPEGCAGACAAELKAHVRQCIEQLPESYRTVLLLRDIEERDTMETAYLLGESQANVKTRLHRARQALRPRIESFTQS